MDEGFFVILALLVPPLLTLGTMALVMILAQAVRRRPIVKSAFNAGQALIAAGVGLAVSRSIDVPSDPLTAGQLAAMAAGMGAYVLVNTVLITGIFLSTGTSWSELASDLPVVSTLAGAGVIVGLILALAIQAHLWALALVIPGLVLERQLISARFAALHDRSRMKGLYEVALEANRGLRQHQAVLEAILGAARGLLRSPGAILTDDEPEPGQLAAPMTVAGGGGGWSRRDGAGTSRSTRPTRTCCGPWPPWAAERSATLSSSSRSTSNGRGCPRSRSTLGKASAPSTQPGS